MTPGSAFLLSQKFHPPSSHKALLTAFPLNNPLIIAFVLFVIFYNLLDARQIVLAASFSAASFVFILLGLGLITFDKDWMKERHELERKEKDKIAN